MRPSIRCSIILPLARASMSQATLKSLKNALSIDCKDEHLVFVHQFLRMERPFGWSLRMRMVISPKQAPAVEVPNASYTLQEFVNVRCRPFASRLYISATNVDYQTVWLHTRFSDNSMYMVPTRKIRDFVKAALTSRNLAGRPLLICY
jgi:hypothetical protein